MQTKLFHSFAMTMSKASEEDLCMAIDLAGALDALTDTWCARMPDEVARLEGDDSIEPFDRYDDEQCGRVLRHLLYTANRGSLFRVVFGMAVVLNPSNSCVNHEADTIERHPDAVAGLAAKTPRQLADWHEDDGTVLWWRMPVEEPPYCGSPLADDWPGCHTHWTPILVPDALPVEVSA